MATLDFYPDTFCRDICEHHQIKDGQSLHEWFSLNIEKYDPLFMPFTVLRNGEIFADFNEVLGKDDKIELILRPGDPITLLVISLAITAISIGYQLYTYFTYTTPKQPSLGKSSPIYDANVQGNQARLREPIPEIFGRHLLYPDIISQPWREYIANDQWIHLLLSVGVGEFDIDPDQISIANTPVTRYGADVDLDIFLPGADVTSHIAHRNIYTSLEVGASSASTGIDLKGPADQLGEIGISGVAWDFVNDTLRFVINGNMSGSLPKFQSATFIEITSDAAGGDNDGKYHIDSYDVPSQTFVLTKYLDDLSGPDPDWGTTSPATYFVPAFAQTAAVVIIDDLGGGGYFGPYLACPLTETTSKIYLDFTLPSLFRINRAGEVRAYSIDIEIGYRDSPTGGAYTLVPYTITDMSMDAIGITLPIDLGSPITPEVRVRRITYERSTAAVQDKILWQALKSELVAATSYADVTTIAISAKGTNVLAGQAENRFNLIATRKLPVLAAGAFGADSPTRTISSPFGYVIRDVGLTDADIDLAELQAVEDTWTARGDHFDGVFDQRDTFFEALKKILAPGYAIPLIESQKITLSRDEPRSVYEQMYQPDNLIVGGIEREYQLIDDDEPDGIEVEYFSEITWKPETVISKLDSDAAEMPEKLQAFGITDRDRAWRFGMRKRRERRYRRALFRFSTELDGLNSRFGSFCALGDDVPGYSQTGSIEAVNGRVLTLSNAPIFEPDSPSAVHFIALRKPDGRLSGPYLAEPGPDEFTVIIGSDLDFTPVLNGKQEPPFYQFGTAFRYTESVLITEVKPQGMDRVDLTAVNYDDRVYDDDDNSAPI